jgi:hypothetical protein
VNSPAQTSEDVAARWTCDSCGVEVRWIGGAERGIPRHWTLDDDDCVVCLSCQRAAAKELAGRPSFRTSIQERLRLRSAGVIEFEIGRDPGRADREIAQALHTSVVAVQKARKRLGSSAPK